MLVYKRNAAQCDIMTIDKMWREKTCVAEREVDHRERDGRLAGASLASRVECTPDHATLDTTCTPSSTGTLPDVRVDHFTLYYSDARCSL